MIDRRLDPIGYRRVEFPCSQLRRSVVSHGFRISEGVSESVLLRTVLNDGIPPPTLFDASDDVPESRDHAVPTVELAILYARRAAAYGDLSEGLAALERSLREIEADGPGSEPAAVRLMAAMGELLIARGDFSGAEAYLLQALVLAEWLAGCRSPMAVQIVLQLSVLYLRMGNQQLGANLRSLGTALLSFPDDASELDRVTNARSVLLLRELHELNGGYLPGEELMQHALQVLAANGTLDRTDGIELKLQLANAAADRGDIHLAEDRIADALREIRLLVGVHSAHFTRALRMAAAIYRRSGKLKRALAVARRSVDLAEQGACLGPRELGLALRDYGILLSLIGRPRAARPVLERAIGILAQESPAGREAADLLDLLVDIAESCDWHARAAAYRARSRFLRRRRAEERG